MRLKIGRIVDADADVNLSDLSPIDRIIAAGISAYHNTDFYKRRIADSDEKIEEENRKIRDAIISNLSIVVSAELESNKSLASKGDVCRAIIVEIPSRFVPMLSEALSSHYFDAYNIRVIPPSKMLKKFADPPYCLYIENKGG